MSTTSSSAEFGTVDYGMFSIMLSISLSIGIYFGFCGNKSKGTDEYLIGNRKMKTIPVAISLIASQISGITLIGTPAEIYSYGTQSFLMIPGVLIATLMAIYVFVPVFFKLGLYNSYEYLEMRFDKNVRKMVALLYLLHTYLFIPVIIFIPALSFSQVTGINIHVINTLVIVVCVTYTMLGGIKAVIWTDVIQAVIILGACVVVLVISVADVGGVATVIQRASDAGRIEFFNMNPSFTARTSFWNQLIGFAVCWTGYVSLNQSCVQRFATLPTYKHAKVALYIFIVGFSVIVAIATCIGLAMFATYYNCDPVKLGIVSKADKLVSYFVLNSVSHIPGIPGIFIAGIFSASLSTMSAALNSASGIVYQDFVRDWNLFKHTDSRANTFMKGTVIVSGVYSILFGFVVEQFGHIIQVANTVLGLTMGTTLGIYILGMLIPSTNKVGAFVGGLVSTSVMIWIAIGAQIALLNGGISYPPLPTSIEGCNHLNYTTLMTTTQTAASILPVEEPFILYRLSFNYYALVGTLITLVTGLIVSRLTGPQDARLIGSHMFSPCIQWLLPKDILMTKISNDDVNDKTHRNIEMKLMETDTDKPQKESLISNHNV